MVETFITGLFSLVSAILGYVLGRRSKLDDILISKRCSIAENVSLILTQDQENRKLLRQDYQNNYQSLDSISEVATEIEENKLHAQVISLIKQTSKRLDELRELIDSEVVIYLPPSVTEDIREYLEETSFSYGTDGIGLVNEYIEYFYINLLNKNSERKLSILYKKIIKNIRKMVA